MTDRIVLMLAYHFPPENTIGAIRPFRFYKYLSRAGYRCQVITAADQGARPVSDVEWVPDPFVARPRQGMGWQAERAIRKLLLPGMTGIQWSVLASKAARSFLPSNADAEMTVFSTYPPLGTHLAALCLVQGTGLKWIADFRDPLADNPGHHGWTTTQTKACRWLEKKVLNTADVVVANTDVMAEKWKALYPRRRDNIHLIWNGFDPEDRLRARPIPARSYQVVSHIGELYGGRSVSAVLESISRLIEAGRLFANRVRIKLVGSVENGSLPDPEFLRRAREQGWLEIIASRVPLQDARQIAQTSDGLLLIQPQSSVQVPAKLFDYLQIGRPVLAFIPPDTPIERILQRSGVPYRCVYTGSSTQETDTAVESYFSLTGDVVPASTWFEQNFDAKEQTRSLDVLIHSMHQRRNGCAPVS
jgi:glycosyltransferase involved in cell wall biosynthesis